MITNKNKTKDVILEHIINRIVQIANPDKIILFGSRATGKAKKDSDYDVCVLKKGINTNTLSKKIYNEGLNADAPVDVIVATPARFNVLKDVWYYIHYDIHKFGKVVYEKNC